MQLPEPRDKSTIKSDEAARRNARASMRLRGWLKVVLLTMAVDQLLTAIFTYVTQNLGLAAGQTQTLIFSCITCVLASNWLVADARAAWGKAKQEGHIRAQSAGAEKAGVEIGAHCPKRWLVVLHLELNPELASSR
jgi:hypothetical protein